MFSAAHNNTSQTCSIINGEININSQLYAPTGHSVNATIQYTIFNTGKGHGALIDGGANGGLVAGDDVLILKTNRIAKVDVMGMMEGILQSMSIAQCAANLIQWMKVKLHL